MSDLNETLTNNFSIDDTLIYHYTSFESACKILEKNTLRFSNLINLNDPLELFEPHNFDFITDLEDYQITKILNDLDKSLEERRNTVRLLSFCVDINWKEEKSQNKYDNLLLKGWARNRMWAQYARNHSGVCLVFDKEEFNRKFNELGKIIPQIKPITEYHTIKYTNGLLDLQDGFNLEVTNSNINNDFSHFFLEKERIKYLFQKCEDFRDESEYRFALIDNSLKSPSDELFVDFGTSLKAIIYGQRFSSVIKFAVHKNIEQYNIYWKCGAPELIKL